MGDLVGIAKEDESGAKQAIESLGESEPLVFLHLISAIQCPEPELREKWVPDHLL